MNDWWKTDEGQKFIRACLRAVYQLEAERRFVREVPHHARRLAVAP